MPAPPPPVAVDADALVQAALSTRAEIAAADEQVRAARGQLLAARLAAAPTLSASGSAFASNQPYSTGDKTGWRATVDLNWTLLQGGLRAANDGRAQAMLADAEAAADAAHLQVAQQVRNAAADLESATARVEVTGRQRALAEEAAKVAQRSYENGTVDARDVLDALDRLDLARTSEVDARARLGMADAALRAATGKW
jgi:outer membrane protein TolC